ncbi:PhnD/SsuA/transferrin family substrate-binding protein [Paraglaciecola marina]|uniref:PhnD/SsuA/transferrin family substrate-binding protein n=1 Tax=Paraglaciecola marina TaxID=2500157 RepID=UPI001EF135EC|nr:PhnD/SsuA/transferrin family substrate-binding protein [Paraglaciecola marina]
MSIFSPYYKTIFLSAISLSIILMWCLGAYVNVNTPEPIPVIINESDSCHTLSKTNADSFVVLVEDQYQADLLLDALCSDPVIDRQFGVVEVRWSNRDEDIIQYIGKGLAHLALVKENLMNAFATDQTYGYKVIGAYQNYSAYLISVKEKPIINKQYLWGKKLGLLDYPSSRSGHIIPKGMLKSLDLSEQDVKITYANDHNELRKLLASGKVDIISSYWQEEDSKKFSQNYITRIQENVSGAKWYLKMDTQNTDLVCEMQKILLMLSPNMGSEYFNHMSLPDECLLIEVPQL